MFTQEVKIFRDSVHGYIEVPVDYVERFIDTDVFQRLRGIEQTGMRMLYPSARHDRFIHSLGTFFLGHKAFLCFRTNVFRSYGQKTNTRADHYHIYQDEKTNELFWRKCQVLFEIACLLHDCGHAPFSHTFEFHYDSEPAIDEKLSGTKYPLNLKGKLKSYLGSQEFKKDFEGQGTPHERMSGLLVCAEFSSQIDNLLTEYGLNQIEDGNPVEFVVRMIIGCKYTRKSHSNQIKNCLIELLNSRSIDVDSLDYVIRDAKLSGIDNMNIDVNRLLGSLTLVETTEFSNCTFHNQEIATTILDGKLEKGNMKIASMQGKCRGRIDAQGECSGYILGMVSFSGNARTTETIPCKEETVVTVNGARCKERIPNLQNRVTLDIEGLVENKLKFEGNDLTFSENTNGRIGLSSNNTIAFTSTYVDATLNGKFTGILLGNYADISGANVECILGFHKSSLSVIQNVVIARNYEYQWIYSHHKVVYYANYLLVDLLKNCVDFLLTKYKEETPHYHISANNAIAQMLSWPNMISSDDTLSNPHYFELAGQKYFRVSDADILSLYKRCQIEAEPDSPLGRQLKEFSSRRYKKSMWKSFAEFHIMFSEFTEDEKNQIFNLIQKNSGYHLTTQYGYFNVRWEKEFNKFGMFNVVWVNGDSKMKSLNPDETFILFKNTSMTYRMVSNVNDIKSLESINLFYLYYECPEGSETNIQGFLDFLRNELVNNT